ncbi:MAG: FGGY family carbohydrate kinase, partial [Acidimicrobiaceae bacterium]|nr:FGGY family carbohydrate kinase [Acidimicrobiaceae bacterium]
MSLIAALDVGTTTVRAAVFDGKERLGIARQGVRAAYPFSGAVEQDPAEIVGSARDVLQHSVRSSGLTVADVDGLAITNQRASVLAWDSETSEPLSPLISWQDTRTAA